MHGDTVRRGRAGTPRAMRGVRAHQSGTFRLSRGQKRFFWGSMPATALAQCKSLVSPGHAGTEANVSTNLSRALIAGILVGLVGSTQWACSSDQSSGNEPTGVGGSTGGSGGTTAPGGDCVAPLLMCDEVCVDATTNAAHCGDCSVACSVPQQHCAAGACACSAGFSPCGATCADLTSDPLNCGACGVSCGGQFCSPAGCTDQCAAPLQACGQSCVDVTVSASHCGGCNQPCADGETCQGGVCSCGGGQSLCGTECIDLQSNPAHCGGCNTPCASGSCTSGACDGEPSGSGGTGGVSTGGTGGTTTGGAGGTATVACDGGEIDCWGACVDPQTDPDNCGTCGTACPTGECNAGECPVVKLCYAKTAIVQPLIADWESYDGTSALDSWGFAFNAASGDEAAVYAGPYTYDDGSGTPTMSMVTGHESDYSISLANAQATEWGGAVGLWMSCVDASEFDGVSFWVRGDAPTGTATLTLAMEDTAEPDAVDPAGGGTCLADCTSAQVEFPVTTAWTEMKIPWGSFAPGTAGGAPVPVTGDNITGFAWQVSLAYMADPADDTSYIPAPSAYGLEIDDIRFIGEEACTAGEMLCGVGCVDPNVDPDNCGGCGTVCDPSQTCTGGACTCPEGYTICNDECVNTSIDSQHCGGCDSPCSGQCSAGSCEASSCTAGMPQENRSCTAYEETQLGKYWVNNNVWGEGDGATGTQCTWSTCESGNTIGWGTDWTWSGGEPSQVKSFASVVLGWHWGWVIPAATTGLPIQLSAGNNVTCGWTFAVDGDGTMNVAYDLWLHNTSNPDYATEPTDEVMIWLHRGGGAGPIGGVIDPGAAVAGSAWDLHQGVVSSWNVYSYVRHDNTTSATFDLMEFLNDLVDRNLLQTSKYLTSIEAGTEVFNGSGQLDTSAYYCTIQ